MSPTTLFAFDITTKIKYIQQIQFNTKNDKIQYNNLLSLFF